MVELPELIEWYEGMLLAPQHFQQLTERSELLVQSMFSQAGGFRWGVLDLRIDEAALGSGELSVLSIEAILPDGLPVSGGSRRGAPIERFRLRTGDGVTTRIYLTVPAEPALYARTEYSRYKAAVSRDQIATDPLSGADPASIPRLRPWLRLMDGSSDMSGLVALPLLEFRMQGTVPHRTDYIAPMLRVPFGSPLAELCAGVQQAVRRKATELASRLNAEAAAGDPLRLQRLQWLTAGLPALEAMLATEQTHPHTLYLALCAMAGSVACLSNARVPPPFPAYDHTGLLKVFTTVADFIHLALMEGLLETWVSVEFTLVSRPVPDRSDDAQAMERMFAMDKPLASCFRGEGDFSAPFFGLMLRWPADTPSQTMTEWGRTALLAGEEDIVPLEVGRAQGAVCERVDQLDDLAPAPRSVLFRVANNPRWFDPRRKLALKPAQQETRMPLGATLFLPRRTPEERDDVSAGPARRVSAQPGQPGPSGRER